jgi:hypothetical protein
MPPWDPEAARAASITALAPYGIELGEHFPLLGEEDVGAHRPLEEVVARAQALVCMLNAAHGAPPEKVSAVLDEHGLQRWVSTSEREFLDDPGDQRAAQLLTWRVEALYALTWVLEVADDLPLEGSVRFGEDLLAPVDPLSATAAPTTLRDAVEVAARLDLFYCAHWAVRENHLTGRFTPWPEALVGGVIEERRHGLEWFFAPAEDEWDELPLST